MSAKFPRGGEQTHSQPSVYIAWFAGRDVAKYTARGNIDRLTGSDVEFRMIHPNVNVFMVENGRKCISYIYYIIKQLLTYVW